MVGRLQKFSTASSHTHTHTNMKILSFWSYSGKWLTYSPPNKTAASNIEGTRGRTFFNRHETTKQASLFGTRQLKIPHRLPISWLSSAWVRDISSHACVLHTLYKLKWNNNNLPCVSRKMAAKRWIKAEEICFLTRKNI